jgi:hypothetical protein
MAPKGGPRREIRNSENTVPKKGGPSFATCCACRVAGATQPAAVALDELQFREVFYLLYVVEIGRWSALAVFADRMLGLAEKPRAVSSVPGSVAALGRRAAVRIVRNCRMSRMASTTARINQLGATRKATGSLGTKNTWRPLRSLLQ